MNEYVELDIFTLVPEIDFNFKYDLAKTRESIRLSTDFIEKKIIW